ncbi:hypothetical protein V6U90_26300 [Micromonospora sp. CPCC 206060]|uniref:hypothetical protein n=1 Tax=Micromonospora sp. CPCC 206060 TaxID=3122406 RepID=UPI002FF36E16
MKWKWFQRRNGVVDEIGPATEYPHRAGSYGRPARPEEADEPPDSDADEGRPGPDRPSWNQRTYVFPRHTPLLTRGGLQRVSQRPGAHRG